MKTVPRLWTRALTSRESHTAGSSGLQTMTCTHAPSPSVSRTRCEPDPRVSASEAQRVRRPFSSELSIQRLKSEAEEPQDGPFSELGQALAGVALHERTGWHVPVRAGPRITVRCPDLRIHHQVTDAGSSHRDHSLAVVPTADGRRHHRYAWWCRLPLPPVTWAKPTVSTSRTGSGRRPPSARSPPSSVAAPPRSAARYTAIATRTVAPTARMRPRLALTPAGPAPNPGRSARTWNRGASSKPVRT